MPESLDIGTLALFVGFAAAAHVQGDLDTRGHTGLRFSHGYVFQHLIDAEPTIGELAQRLEMTQQGASKVVAELEGLGYLERVADARDARVRRVRLTPRGRDAVAAARRARADLEHTLIAACGVERVRAARSLLAELLHELGGAEAVHRRQIRPPR